MINRLLRNLARNANMQDILQHSIKDYHTKGFDYICLHRSYDLTVKLYFFDDDIAQMPEVINPHDHRYDFETYILAGSFTDLTYRVEPNGEVFQKFSYDTPLNGGNGFAWVGEERLVVSDIQTRNAGENFYHDATDFHTIRINQPNTVLCLLQYADKFDFGKTNLFSKVNVAPNTSGMYNKFNPDQIIKRLNQLNIPAPL